MIGPHAKYFALYLEAEPGTIEAKGYRDVVHILGYSRTPEKANQWLGQFEEKHPERTIIYTAARKDLEA